MYVRLCVHVINTYLYISKKDICNKFIILVTIILIIHILLREKANHEI